VIRPTVLALSVLLLALQSPRIETRSPNPVVDSISRVYAKQTQTIVIVGRNFGDNQAYNGDSSFLWMVDIQGNGTGWWRAGCPQQYGPCTTTLSVSSWSDSQIVITGFTGAGQYPQSGDLVSFFIWNPQTGRGPAAAARMIK
jgi:hypothetical protein